jgi:exodeoxyribonuclease V alpha subunit
MMYYLPDYRVKEEELGFMIARHASYKCDSIDPIVDELDDIQSTGVYNACNSNLSLLSGIAGTGKTTVLKCIARSFLKSGARGMALCPTGKAAKRLQEVAYSNEGGVDINKNNFPVKTIHMCLRFQGGEFLVNEENKIMCDFIIIDEATMCDLVIMNALLRSIDWKKTRIVITGDHNQLPSIGPGKVFYDMLGCQFLKKAKLTKIYRQDEGSGIVTNASRILNGDSLTRIGPNGKRFTDCEFIQSTPERAGDLIIDSVATGIQAEFGFNPLTDIQVISPGKKGTIGTENLNNLLRLKLNTAKKAKYCGFMVGDKVINRRNDYENNVVNGDVGIVVDLTKYGLVVNFESGAGKAFDGKVDYTIENIGNLKLAYSYTVHSSQGSEYPCVVIPIFSTHWILLFRNLLYTAMTRPRKRLIIYYEPKALRRCIDNTESEKRITNLCLFINRYIDYFSKGNRQ